MIKSKGMFKITVIMLAIFSLAACGVPKPLEIKEELTLKFAVGTSQAEDVRTKKLLQLVEDKTGYKCRTIVVPGNELDSTKKMRVSIMAGDEYDFIYSNTDTCYNYAQTGIVIPLDSLIADTGYKAERMFGKYLKRIDGKVYMLPEVNDVHLTYYNKKIFDDAKMPYPSGDWTWQDYVETAKKLTDTKKDIYGSYFLEWPMYFTFSAKQKKTPLYKPDGTSNLDDPAWMESFKFMSDLGNLYKVQPDYLTYRTEKMSYDMFFQGKTGMWPAGSWILTMISDLGKYPRDWKIGITSLPQAGRGEKITFNTLGGYSIISTTRHKKEVFEAIQTIGEYAYTVCTDFPCRADLGPETIDKISEQMASMLTYDGITAADIKKIMFNGDFELVPENETGPGSFVIMYTLIPEYGELYCTGQKNIEDTMKELKQKADEVIREEINERN